MLFDRDSEHVDAERLAAWADGSLSSREAAEVDAHLADCAECQALAAAFARTLPDTPAALPIWKRWSWLLPVATLAAAALVWAVWPGAVTPPQTPVTTMAHTDTPTATPTPAPSSPKTEATPETKPAPAPAPKKSAPKVDASPVPAAAPPVAPPPAARTIPVTPQSAPPQPAPPPATPPPPQPPVAAPTPPPQMVTPPAPPPAAAPQATTFDRMSTLSVSEVVFEFSSLSPSLDNAQPAAGGGATSSAASGGRGGGRGGRGGGGGGGGGSRAGVAGMAPSPTLVVRWRVLKSGQVEKSIDGGGTWDAAAIDPPAPITSGAAPNALTCWLVGRGGVVLLSTNGGPFKRVSAPAAVDLESVHATDARNATVTTADGRTFATTDGGQSWRAEMGQ